MAQLTVAAFLSKWESLFPTNGNREITASRMRDFRQDIADSFQSIAGAVSVTSWKSPCAVATTGNITLSGEQTIDGVLTSGSRVLVKNQTTTSQNGIYVSAAGAWSRSTDADDAAELEGAAVGVTQGTTQQNTVWLQTSDNITLGSTAIAWQQIGFGFSSGIDGTLTANRIPKAMDSNTLEDSEIYQNSTFIGIGTTSPDRKFHIEIDSATNNAVEYAARLTKTTSATADQAGIGVGIEMESEYVSGNAIFATIEALAINAFTLVTEIVFRAVNNGSLVECLRITNPGSSSVGLTIGAGDEGGVRDVRAGSTGSNCNLRLLPKGTGIIDFQGPAKLLSYTVAGVPSASTAGAGAMIYVSNEAGGAVPAFSDGTDWRRVTDRNVIS